MLLLANPDPSIITFTSSPKVIEYCKRQFLQKKKPKKFLKQNNITIKIPVKKVANRKTWTRRRMNDTLSINVENLPETTMFRCET